MVENQLERKIQIFQSDGGREFVNKEFAAHLSGCGIKHYLSCPHTPEQNGLAERKHRHLLELGMSMMFEAKLPQNLWVETLFTANFLTNLLPHSATGKTTSPYEKLNGVEPHYSALRVLGCACYPYLRPYAQNKFDPKSLLCVFLGYTEKHKGYWCLHPPTGRVYISRHVLFDESRFPFFDVYQSSSKLTHTPLLAAWYKGLKPAVSEDETVVEASQEEFITGNRRQIDETPVNAVPYQYVAEDFPPLPSPNHVPIPEHLVPEPAPTQVQAPAPVPEDNTHAMVTRGKDGIRKPNPRYVLHTVKGVTKEPRTLAEALSHPGWNGAMSEEVGTCHETGTWSLVPHPKDDHVIGCRWVHKVKLHADGTVEKLRSRIVAKGNEQEEGVDFLETYSPVVRTATIRLVLHTATVNHWDIKQLDVKNAFLHGDLAETVYMKQPSGFEDTEHPDYVCLLHKAIYGLKQAPRAWFDKFSTFSLGVWLRLQLL